MKIWLAGTLIVITFLSIATSAVYGQRRDYMTDEEIEMVRDAQDIDLRIAVLVQMIDRRFEAIGVVSGGSKIKPKELEKWGAMRETSKSQAYAEIRELLQKAADDIDDIAGRNEISQTQNKMEGKLFPKAVRFLATASQRYIPHFQAAEAAAESAGDRGNLQTSLELAESIIEAAKKLPPETRK